MKKILLFALSMTFFATYAQKNNVTFELSTQLIEGGDYKVELILPPNYDANKAYPAFYFLDQQLADSLMKAVVDSLLHNKLVQPFLFVGISCNDTSRWCSFQRSRDFSPTYNVEEDLYLGLKDTSKHVSGGGPNFLNFLKQELIPEVEKRHKVSERALFGISFSGLFVSYVLLDSPQLFSSYSIGAPTLWYDNNKLLKQFEKANPKNFESVRLVYLGVGEKEVLANFNTFNTFSAILAQKEVMLKKEVYQGKDHIGIWKPYLINAMLNVFPK